MHRDRQRTMGPAFLGLVLGLLVSAAGLLADPLPVAMSERIDVVEVQLEVMIKGRDGRPIEDLSKDDFHVEIGGEPVAVLAVDAVGSTPASAPAEGSKPPAAPGPAQAAVSADESERAAFDDSLTLVLFLDEQNLRAATGGRMLGQIYRFLESELRPGDRVMVVSYDRGVHVWQPLTDDLDVVREALVDMVNEHAGHLTMDPEQEIVRTLQQMVQAGFSCTHLQPIATTFAQDEYHRTRDAVAGLQRFVESLAGLRGRKAILHVSNGLPLVAGRAAQEVLIDVCSPAGSSRGVAQSAPLNERTMVGEVDLSNYGSSEFDTSQAWHELAARANRNNVTFYPLQATGLVDPTFASAENPGRTLSPAAGMTLGWNRQDALVMVAIETGGAAILNQNRVADALGDMRNDLRRYYRVSVRVNGGEAGEVEAIKVHVDRPGATVRYRKSLRLQSRSEKVADGVLAAALHGTGENPMGLTAEMQGSSKVDKNLRSVRVQLNIPIASLTLLPAGPEEEPEASSKGQFTVFVAATDAEGGTTPVRRSTLTVERTPGKDDDAETYVFEVEMKMRKGEHVVGFGVLDEIGGGSSFLRTVVEG